MDMPGKDGHTRRKQLKKIHENVGHYHDDLNDPEVPYCATHLLRTFYQLNNMRTSGLNGQTPISYQDLISYQELWGWQFEAWEIDAILAMDIEYRIAADKQKD
tara:strand:- start:7569 stop:7877 length:309 start_codon:yes stop_codon:yes gene_type:complete